MRRWKRRGLENELERTSTNGQGVRQGGQKGKAGRGRAPCGRGRPAHSGAAPDSTSNPVQTSSWLTAKKGRRFPTPVDDLKRFVEARERADKAFRPEPRGVPLAQLENASREADRQRSQEVKSALLYKVSGNMLFFQVQGNIDPHCLAAAVRLEDWERHLHNPYLNPHSSAAKESRLPAGYDLTAHVGATSTGIATSRRSVASPSIPQKNRTSQKSVTPA